MYVPFSKAISFLSMFPKANPVHIPGHIYKNTNNSMINQNSKNAGHNLNVH